MSKNLEKEYREFTNQDAPDLWERIKSGLEEKGAAEGTGGSELREYQAATKGASELREYQAVAGGVSKPRAFQAGVEGGLPEERSAASGAGRRKSYWIWGTAAACLCLAVTGFSLRSLSLPKNGMSGEGLDGNPMNGNANILFVEHNAYEAAEDFAGAAEGMEGAGEMEGAAGMEAAAELGIMADGMEIAANPGINNMEEPGVMLEAPMENLTAAEGAAEGECTGNIVLQVMVTDVMNEEGQVIYTAEIRASEDLTLQAGGRITLYEGRSGSELLEEGEVYEIYAFELAEFDGEKTYRLAGVK
ncbi:MAG: hypothetical protein NC432_06030 [Roseburia sp.]|nr:hypothetical protein [Roseburia sp.]MCM1099553.1 hypothetical protein [Ruminococcus flavefaciens]